MLLATMALAAPSLDGLGKVVVFMLALSVLIVLHEGGHFLVARLNGVRVNDFAIGFGPTLLKWTSPRSGTNYRLNLLPLGGYCAMQGEDGKTSEAEQQRAFRNGQPAESDNFQAKSPLKRLAIVVAGPIANFVLAYAIFFVAAVAFGIPSLTSWSTMMGDIKPDSPAARAGLQFGDRVVAIDGVPYANGGAVVDKIHGSAGKRIALTYERHGVEKTVFLVPAKFTDKEKGKTVTVGRIGFVVIP